jgi:flagellar biogenesis protein FliO
MRESLLDIFVSLLLLLLFVFFFVFVFVFEFCPALRSYRETLSFD